MTTWQWYQYLWFILNQKEHYTLHRGSISVTLKSGFVPTPCRKCIYKHSHHYSCLPQYNNDKKYLSKVIWYLSRSSSVEVYIVILELFGQWHHILEICLYDSLTCTFCPLLSASHAVWLSFGEQKKKSGYTYACEYILYWSAAVHEQSFSTNKYHPVQKHTKAALCRLWRRRSHREIHQQQPREELS